LVALLLCLAAVLNYMDRSVMGLLAPTIQKELAISDQQYATVINFFLAAYTISYLASGRLVDKLGVRISMALFVAWWSISNASTGLAQSVRSLSTCRFSLGLGEAGGFTASLKAVSEWFPPSERGIAVGLYSIGSAIGATVAPILVTLIAMRYGWRWVFATSPVLAGFWLILWLWLYRKPMDHPRIAKEEREYLWANMERIEAVVPGQELSERELWDRVLRSPYVWQLMIARMLTDPVWYFYQFWMAKYLHTSRGLSQAGLSIMWVVFVAADAGFLLGGYHASRMIKHGMIPRASRIRVMGLSACLVPLSLLVPFAPSALGVILITIPVAYAVTAWLCNLTALIVDITPKQILGTAFGVIACGSAFGGILMNQGIAWLVTHRSYDDGFYLMAMVHPLAFLLVRHLRRGDAPIPAMESVL
jgi:ACS family hexuronate transporter-like MFS transporter